MIFRSVPPQLGDSNNLTFLGSAEVVQVLLAPLSLILFELLYSLLLLMDHRLRRYSRIGLRALRIGASTLALVALLRSEWAAGAGASIAWLLFIQVERRWHNQSEAD